MDLNDFVNFNLCFCAILCQRIPLAETGTFYHCMELNDFVNFNSCFCPILCRHIPLAETGCRKQWMEKADIDIYLKDECVYICNCVLPLNFLGVLSPFEEFEVLLEPSWPGHLQLGQRPKPKPNKTKLKSKIELKQCFWSILCYSEFSVIKSMYSSWRNQWIKPMPMNSLFLGTMFGPCLDHV